MVSPVSFDNVQGLVRSLYRYPISRHLIFRVEDALAGRAFIATLVPMITTAAVDLSRSPEPLMNVGITWEGLKAIGVFDTIGPMTDAEQAFPDEFIQFPADADAGDWDGRLARSEVHLLIHLHCMTEGGLEEASRIVRNAAASGLTELKPFRDPDGAMTGRSLGGAKLHFGFIDGISQPQINWSGVPSPSEIDPGHFVLGRWTEKVQSFPHDGIWGDLVCDGTYGAFQWIRQDVATFETYLTNAAPALGLDLPLKSAREFLAAKMMGRWRGGAPLALAPEADDPSLSGTSTFGYADDPTGTRCPLHAHVRIANRRNEQLNPVIDPSFPDGGPFLLRRGMAYGPELIGEIDDGMDRGLIGLFLCANPLKQFFTVLRWINQANFSPVFDGQSLHRQDLLMGDRRLHPDAELASLSVAGRVVALPPLPQFIKIKATVVTLLLGIEGLKTISASKP